MSLYIIFLVVMKKGTRIRLAIYGLIFLIISAVCIVTSQSPVEYKDVEEISRVENTPGVPPYYWNVSAEFNKGDIICGLMLPPPDAGNGTGWLYNLEPGGSFEEPYGEIPFPHMFAWLKLYNDSESEQSISTTEIVLVYNPDLPPGHPMQRRLLVFNMSYLYGNTSEYHPVETVPSKPTWVILTPEGIPSSGIYTLRVETMPLKDIPPAVIALGKLYSKYRYEHSFLLPVGIALVLGGSFLTITAVHPDFLEKIKRNKSKSRRLRIRKRI